MSPDPSGLYFADPTNPQSLNLYSYALNNPLKLIDPSGLTPCDYGPSDQGGNDYEDADNDKECTDNGGKPIDYSETVNVNANGSGDFSLSTVEGGGSTLIQTGQFVAPSKIACYRLGVVGCAIASGLQALTKYAGKFPNGNGTGLIFGIAGGGAGGTFAGDGSRAFVTDGQGNVGVVTSVAFGAGSSILASASGGLLFGDSSYQSLSNYSGSGTSATISGGAGLGGSASVSSSSSGYSVSYTVGAGYGLSASGQGMYSWVTPVCK